MEKLSTDVLVIGGGGTGAGVAWDATLRGLDVVLVDRSDLATGTSGRFHGLLHSGGRYAVKDPSAADECARENIIVRQVANDCIEDTGGFFVTTPFDDPAYADQFAEGCRKTGVPCEEIAPAQALREEPRLNPQISRAFRVPDASVDVWKLVSALARGARDRGARVLPYHEAVAVHRDGDVVRGARVRDSRNGDELEIEARVTVSASGAWAGQIAALAGIEGVHVMPGRGIMIAMNHRLVNTVINRCQMPTDGDIIVPDPHRQRDRDDRCRDRRSRRPLCPPARGRRDARGWRAPRAGVQGGARAAGLGRCAAAVRGPQGEASHPPATSRAHTPCSTTTSATA